MTTPHPHAMSAVENIRAALEQAIAALEGVLDAPVGVAAEFWSCAGGVYEAVECNNAINALQAELDKPPIQQAPQVPMTDAQPAWHDAPNAPGMWVQWASGLCDLRTIYATEIGQARDWRGRWFGPLPPDALALPDDTK